MSDARPEIHFSLTSATGGSGPGSGPDRFAPKYLVGNVPNGDSALAYNTAGFMYIPDGGNGAGIATALTQPNGPGDIWIRPGKYTKAQARFIVPPNVRVWGAGYTTVIVGSGLDNCIWEVGERSEVAWMYNTHPGPIANVGEAVIYCHANVTYVHDIVVDASAASAGSVLIAGVAYSGVGGGGPIFSRLHNNVIVGPPGAGVFDVATMYANIRGLTLAQNDTVVVDAQSNTLIAGDAGVVSLGDPVGNAQGISFIIGRAFMIGPAVLGLYFDFSPMIMSTGPSIVLAFAPTIVAGAIVLNTFQYEFGGTLLLNLTDQGQGGVPVPGIIVSEPNPVFGSPPTSADIHDCTLLFWGDPNDSTVPQILLGQNAELVRSARVVSNRLISATNVTPVVLGAGCSNSLVGLNTSDGSGGVNALDLGAGNAPNVNNLWT